VVVLVEVQVPYYSYSVDHQDPFVSGGRCNLEEVGLVDSAVPYFLVTYQEAYEGLSSLLAPSSSVVQNPFLPSPFAVHPLAHPYLEALSAHPYSYSYSVGCYFVAPVPALF
jgi:hypothetical protein